MQISKHIHRISRVQKCCEEKRSMIKPQTRTRQEVAVLLRLFRKCFLSVVTKELRSAECEAETGQYLREKHCRQR